MKIQKYITKNNKQTYYQKNGKNDPNTPQAPREHELYKNEFMEKKSFCWLYTVYMIISI